MPNDGATRLEQALELLGYQQAKEPHHKTNLLHAIQLHAVLIGNKELETDCYVEMERVRTEIKRERAEINAISAKRGTVAVQVNVGDNQRNSAGKLKPGTVQINIGRNQRICKGDFYE